MSTLARLFGKSPFSLLHEHMEKVSVCVKMLEQLFDENEEPYSQKCALKISKLEHQADLTKNKIRNNLSKAIFLPISKIHLLTILSLQDTLADKAEDVAVLVTLQPLIFIGNIQPIFKEFFEKNMEAFSQVYRIINELEQLLESSFGGEDAKYVSELVEKTAFLEHEADLIQRKLMKEIFSVSKQMDSATFYLWMKIITELGGISDISEKLANRIQMTLECK